MTCIVGIVAGDKVILGADSAGVSGLDRRIRRDPKVFASGQIVMGFTSSFRMGQLLQYDLSPPPFHEELDPFQYAVRSLVPAIRRVLKDGGYAKTESGREEGGSFLVGFRGRLFTIHSDFQVGEDVGEVAAVGCGESYALGAMHALSAAKPMRRLQAGLDAAAAFSAGVAAPFNFVETP